MHPAIEFQLNMLFFMRVAPIAQPVEHLICNQGVGSSSLSGGTMLVMSMKSMLLGRRVGTRPDAT